MSITQRPYGTLPDGQMVTLYTLTNASGASVGIIDFGGIIINIIVPDRDGKLEDVNLSYDDVAVYTGKRGSFGSMGALIGRIGNRIGEAKFILNGQEYLLDKNDGNNSLHGGLNGFNKRMWHASPQQENGVDKLTLTLLSPDGDQGFPGELSVTVTYSFDNNNALSIDYHATTTKPTIVNLTNHAYFNLDGHASGTMREQELQIFADSITEVGPGLIPTGRLIPAADTNYGFQTPTKLGNIIDLIAQDEALKAAAGVDFNYCMGRDRENKVCAILYSPKTGRQMTVETDQPGVQVYMGQHLNNIGKDGANYGPFGGLCLETQHYPDAINHPQFHSVVLRPQDCYASYTVYRFDVR